MSLRLDIRPCWKWECPACERVIRYPTTKVVVEAGYDEAERHLLNHHGIRDRERVLAAHWEKDHWANLRDAT